MPPIIDIIRHAEATHNTTTGNVYERDPNLTSNGADQAFSLSYYYPFMHKISHIVSSPMRRCIRTALIGFEYNLLQGKRVILLPELQETGANPSDIGQPPEALEAVYSPLIDTDLLERNWYDKGQGSKYAPDVGLVEKRARKARTILRDLAASGPDDARIIVITHGGFAHFLTEDYSGLSERYFTAYGNLTIRGFEFVDLLGEDPDAKLVETADSLAWSKLPRFVDLSDEEKARLKSYAVARVELQKQQFERAT
ncbi:histidine phosphatase superfamily [Xylaria bambusicola]|uniref:histidine phosphatase superfamily n=1 Tax=Xylaria bambusicola TaxID=326684 RepID=UPI002008DF37|nr:histidine phosphatase superfamily [Xylaria bambusicola]KAI0508334.1 histidine phosphatase superfamily [Xylaria bambusicola]